MTAKRPKIKRTKPSDERVPIGLRIETSLLKAFNELVDTTNVGFSELIRTAMREFAEKHGKLKAGGASTDA